MNKENTQKLLDAAPKLYSGYAPEREQMLKSLNNNQDRPFSPIAFGFDCADGWFNILLECSIAIENEINKLPLDEQVYCYATQVKEKYGTLRFYMSGYNETIEEIISVAEGKTFVTCEVCGEPGKLRGDSWVRTLCEKHAIEDGYPLDENQEED